MASVKVYWRAPKFDEEQQDRLDRENARTGVLTTEHSAADDDVPVLVEELTGHVYRPGDMPPDAVIYIEDAPGFPDVARLAVDAGFRVEQP